MGRGLCFSLWVSLSLSLSLSLSVGLSLSLSGCVSLWGGFRAHPCYFPRDVSLGPFPPSPLSTRASTPPWTRGPKAVCLLGCYMGVWVRVRLHWCWLYVCM